MPTERVTFSCGHEGRIEVQGRRAVREAKAAWLAERRTCQTCYEADVEKERAEARAEAAELAADFELPDLLGTEKQVDWAMRIRADVVAQKDGADALLTAKLGDDTFLGAKPDAVMEAFEEGFTALVSEQRAAWWIERGGHFVQSEPQPFIAGVTRWHRERAAAGVARTTVVRPAGREPISIVSLSHTKDAVVVTTTRRESDTFTDLLKDVGFRWSESRWEYRCMPSSSPIDHVAAGIASEIVAAGYAVGIEAGLGALVSSGDFEAEVTRKVCTHENGKRFLLEWRRSDDLYNVVKSVPGARWVGYGMSVPLASASEVADLAERLGFWMSTSAQDAVASVDALVVDGRRVEVGASLHVAATAVQGGVHADLVDD